MVKTVGGKMCLLTGTADNAEVAEFPALSTFCRARGDIIVLKVGQQFGAKS